MDKDLEKQATAQIKALEDAAFDRGKADGVKAERERLTSQNTKLINEAFDEGGRVERERIQAIEAQALPGHEALIAELKFDGKTTGAEAAQRVLAAEKVKRDRVLTNLKADAPAVIPAAVAPPSAAVEDPNLPIEDRAKKDWERDLELRKEFSGLAAYTAYLKAQAEGKVRIISKQTQ